MRRQPFGGWKRSAVGAGTKAGGPNYLVGLSDWTSTPATRSAAVNGAVRQLVDLASPVLAQEQREFLHRAVGSDAAAWQSNFGVACDVSGLPVEHNLLRYIPVPAWIRYEAGPPADLVRVVAAGLRAGSELRISVAEPLPAGLAEALEHVGCYSVVEDGPAWRMALAALPAGRVRLLGGQRVAFATDSSGRPEIALYRAARRRGWPSRAPYLCPGTGPIYHGAPIRFSDLTCRDRITRRQHCAFGSV